MKHSQRMASCTCVAIPFEIPVISLWSFFSRILCFVTASFLFVGAHVTFYLNFCSPPNCFSLDFPVFNQALGQHYQCVLLHHLQTCFSMKLKLGMRTSETKQSIADDSLLTAVMMRSVILIFAWQGLHNERKYCTTIIFCTPITK